MSTLNGETAEEFNILTTAGWMFSGMDATRTCRHGWEGRCGTQLVSGPTFELAVRAAFRLYAATVLI